MYCFRAHITNRLQRVLHRSDLLPGTTALHYCRNAIHKVLRPAWKRPTHESGFLTARFAVGRSAGTELSYLPETAEYDIPFKDQITIWQLLNHTAGVFDVVNSDEGTLFIDSLFSVDPNYTITIDIMTSFIAQKQYYQFEPGAAWNYSNSGYQLLAKIIERVSGKTYSEFLTEEFVIPLELNETSFPYEGTEQTLPEPYLDSYLWLIDQQIPMTTENMSKNIGEGNMISSVNQVSLLDGLMFKAKESILGHW